MTNLNSIEKKNYLTNVAPRRFEVTLRNLVAEPKKLVKYWKLKAARLLSREVQSVNEAFSK